ncbi:hypothetical protein VFPBJ_08151 [Purpureocillium lilacinum]|uniref:Uncharacterized protein n=1 Tax=Purpureocillium lilacinum TaxID=33203 RepID=A0A179GKN7_PURLI|nr:hypothetical protein VFPBJ_08151 [Purpureocillium lilacinum]
MYGNSQGLTECNASHHPGYSRKTSKAASQMPSRFAHPVARSSRFVDVATATGGEQSATTGEWPNVPACCALAFACYLVRESPQGEVPIEASQARRTRCNYLYYRWPQTGRCRGSGVSGAVLSRGYQRCLCRLPVKCACR